VDCQRIDKSKPETSQTGSTPLQIACDQGQLDVVSVLLACGASPLAQDQVIADIDTSMIDETSVRKDSSAYYLPWRLYERSLCAVDS
jgi:ankyrin repeat protein